VKVSSSEYLLLAAIAEVAVRIVPLPNLQLSWCCTCLLVLFRLLLIALALIEDGKFISLLEMSGLSNLAIQIQS